MQSMPVFLRHLFVIVESVALKDEVLHDVLMDICDTPVSPELLPPDKNGKIAQQKKY